MKKYFSEKNNTTGMGLEWAAIWAGYPVLDASAAVVGDESIVDAYLALDSLEVAALHAGTTLFLGVLVLGLAPEYGRRSVETVQRSPIISAFVGVPAALVLAALLGIGALLLDSSVGVFFGLPLVVVGVALLPAWIAIGFVGIGGVLTRRIGFESPWNGLLVGAILSGAAALVPPIGYSLLAIAAVLGTGAGLRGLLGGGGAGSRTERVVPPANKV